MEESEIQKNSINTHRHKPAEPEPQNRRTKLLQRASEESEMELVRSKKGFFNSVNMCLGWITFFIIVAIIFMFLFSAHHATPVGGVKAEVTSYSKSEHDYYKNETKPASVNIYLKNTNRFKVTVNFYITHRDNKVSSRKTVVLSAYEEISYGLTLYKDVNLGDISKDDLDINMTITCNSHSYFGFSNIK